MKLRVISIKGIQQDLEEELVDGDGKLLVDLGFSATSSFSIMLDGDVLTINPFDPDCNQ